MIWHYDGSFEGFLSSVVYSYTHHKIPDTIQAEHPVQTLFETPLFIPTNTQEGKRLFDAIHQKLGREILERIYHGYLCDELPTERDLLLYIRMGFKNKNLLRDLSHPTVYAVEQYQKRLLSQRHRMLGFLRFEELHDGVLYAKMTPSCNVLPLLGTHFAKRFGNEHFIIHDLKRKTALIYQHNEAHIHHVAEFEQPKSAQNEAHFQSLWHSFFNTIAIKERHNPKLQRQWVPLRYRKWMHEFVALQD